jgi:cytochrome o ubiquinol oxidase subunit 1
MIVSGVLFGYFAGLTYWFPKVFGFKLNERIGKYAAWCWISGFILAFVPLYILGFMGATRRLDHYSASLGWQPLFIVAGVGAGIIAVGVGLQILQVIVSILQSGVNKLNVDNTGDPWNGRTLEWSTTSPAPYYNFAILPEVHDRDAFWVSKQNLATTEPPKPHYKAFTMPKNSPMGMYIAGFAFLVGFGAVWHMLWLSIVGLLGIILTVIIRTSDDDTERVISVAEIEKIEAKARLERFI